MPYPPYFLRYEQQRNKTMQAFSSTLRKSPKKAAGRIELAELCSMTGYPNGLYFFFDSANTLKYVGKSSSRSFIERIPSHFDQRYEGWFNTLPKKIMQKEGIAHYHTALEQSLKMRLVLLGINGRETINKLESALRCFLQPSLNPGKLDHVEKSMQLCAYEA
jgi:hypothetical protein